MTNKSTSARPSRRTWSRRPRRPRLHPGNWVLHHATRIIPVLIVMAATLTIVVVLGDTVAHAAGSGGTVLAAPASIDVVIDRIRVWLIGVLFAVATLFLTVGGLRLTAANGDPGEAEKAKLALRSAAIGYGLALLAPLFVTIVGQWVA